MLNNTVIIGRIARDLELHETENVSDLAQVAPELIVDYAGFGTTTADAIDAVGVGGTVVLVGMGKLETTI